MTIPIVKPKKTREMSKRERVRVMYPEARYAAELAARAIKAKHEQLGNGIRVNLYLGFTTQMKNRNLFQLFINRELTPRLDFIVVAAGRIGKYDGMSTLPPVFEILDSPGWSTNPSQEEFQDLVTLIDCLTLFIDCIKHHDNVSGHAPYCRHTPITESIKDLRTAINYVCSKHPLSMKGESNGTL